MRAFIVWGLLLLTYATAHAADGVRCAMLFGNLNDPFGPILVYAGAPKPEEIHYLRMSAEQRRTAIDKVKQKLLRTRALVLAGEWNTLSSELNDPTFMDGTGVTVWAPDAKVLYLSPERLAEITASPDLLRKAREEILELAQWESNDKCCSILGTRVLLSDPTTHLVLPASADLIPLNLESTLLMNEEIIHHLQALYHAEGGRPFVSKAFARPGYEQKLLEPLRKAALADSKLLVAWVVRKSQRDRLRHVIEKFKATVTDETPGITPAERALITTLPAQLTLLDSVVEDGSVHSPEGQHFLAGVTRATMLYFTKLPKESKPILDNILLGELREADVYLALRDMYGAKVIDATWRDRYLGRRVADRLE